MTFFYPDISSYESGISLSGMAAVVVKATEGTTYTNPDYARVARDATSRGIPWAAYHFLRRGSGAAQADYFHGVAGNVPCMLDVETAGNGTMATVQDCLDFANRLRAYGSSVRLVYLPHWYWQNLGSPSLVPLAQAGMALVSSNYTTYSDTGPGWSPYGGVTPTVWQYTDAHSLNGFSVDYNAFRGTADEFRALLTEGTITDMSTTDSQNIQDLHDRSNWSVTPAAQLTADTPGHPLAGSMVDRLNAFAQDPKTFLTGAVPVSLSDADRAAIIAALPTAADVATHLDYNALAAAIVSHFKIQ